MCYIPVFILNVYCPDFKLIQTEPLGVYMRFLENNFWFILPVKCTKLLTNISVIILIPIQVNLFDFTFIRGLIEVNGIFLTIENILCSSRYCKYAYTENIQRYWATVCEKRTVWLSVICNISIFSTHAWKNFQLCMLCWKYGLIFNVCGYQY